MTEIYAAVCIGILVVMGVALARAYSAPTVYDRIQYCSLLLEVS